MAGIEHAGLGLAAKKWVPGVHLAVLMIATEVIDILWIAFAVAGMEPTLNHALTHSLLMAAVWSLLCGIAAAFVYRNIRSAIVLGLLVFSHWIVDFITHPMTFLFPDAYGLPFYPGGTARIGLGLYSTLPGLMIGWPALTGSGVTLYVLHRKTLTAHRGVHSRRP
jgi:membrane-bound metal-dependent hydrolase YbcI (DUF457 family)